MTTDNETVMITGATGFVGNHLANQLIDHGYELRLLARTPSKAEALANRGADVIEGDLTDPDSIRRAVNDVDGIFHLAAAYVLGGELDWMRRVNVEGTRNVLDVAQEQGVKKILYCGSDTSLGDTGGEICDESKEHDGDFRSNYAQTKHESHQLVERRMDEGQPIVHGIVSSVYGPGDESPLAELIENHLAGHALAYLDRNAGYTFTHVEDVATGLRLAYERGKPGESYLISGDPATFEEFFGAMSEVSGVPEPRFEVPDWLVDLVKPFAKLGSKLFGKSASEVDEMISMGRNVTRFFSGKKAEDRLNWQARSLKEGLRETVPWFGKQELQKSRKLLKLAAYPLVGLGIFDLILGSTALFAPGLYTGILHGTGGSEVIGGSYYLLPRTGTLWLVFAGVQLVAGLNPAERASWVFSAGVLRLMDVPADPVYYLTTEHLTLLGKAGLLSAPIFNLLTGSFFLYTGYRGLRALRWKPGTIESDAQSSSSS